MRCITKGPPPSAIATLRRTPGATWTSVKGDQKSAMRASALAEQRHLCAYCNRRLHADQRTTMEHWRARSEPGTDPFEWSDLLAVCPGEPNDETCDRHRGNRPLELHPARTSPHPEQVLRFLKDGRIETDDSVRHDALDLLRLDHPTLVRSRRAAVDAVLAIAQDPQKLKLAIDTINDPERPLPEFPMLVVPLLLREMTKREARGKRLRKTR